MTRYNLSAWAVEWIVHQLQLHLTIVPCIGHAGYLAHIGHHLARICLYFDVTGYPPAYQSFQMMLIEITNRTQMRGLLCKMLGCHDKLTNMSLHWSILFDMKKDQT